MPIWKVASAVFTGGTEQIKQLKGRRVRTKRQLELNAYDPIHNRQETVTIRPGSIGILSNHHPSQLSMLLIAFDQRPNAIITTLESMTRGNAFKVIVVNEPTFKMQFEVEC